MRLLYRILPVQVRGATRSMSLDSLRASTRLDPNAHTR